MNVFKVSIIHKSIQIHLKAHSGKCTAFGWVKSWGCSNSPGAAPCNSVYNKVL